MILNGRDEVVRFVLQIAGPCGSDLAWESRAPGEYPAACRFCGDDVLITLTEGDGTVRVGLGHSEPFCAEFARVYEDIT